MSAALQTLYDTLGCQGVAKHLRRTTHGIGEWLRSQGVKVQNRGGKRIRGMNRVPGKIELNRIGNESNGDPAYRASPVRRTPCQHGVTCLGQPYLCVQSDDGECEACLGQHDALTYAKGGAASSWIPADGMPGKAGRVAAHRGRL